MKLKLDPEKTYALVLEGGGARGAYQVGAWKALSENGIRYNAVAGSSVGALNGAMMAMRRLEQAEELWNNIRFSRVMDVDDSVMEKIFDGRLKEIDFKELARDIGEILRGGGLDVTPLKELLSELVDENCIRESDVDFYIATFSVTEMKELYLRAKELEPGALHDMLLASAYYPAFKNEPLRGKRYIDGGVQDVLPLSPLIENGYKDILAIRVYGFGVEKRVEIPEDVSVTTIAPTEKLGSVMDFSTDQAREHFKMGYYDALRTLYGLAGDRYYVDWTWTEAEAHERLTALVKRFELYHTAPQSLREMNEDVLPRLARKVKAEGGYQDVLMRCFETMADECGMERFTVRTDEEFEREVIALAEEQHAWVPLVL